MGRLTVIFCVASVSRAVASCKTDIDCSLNGVCNAGVCDCDAAWGGQRCEILQLMPAALNNGYKELGRASWGGSVIREGDTYHMYVEELVNDCGLNTYARNMRIAHATSSTPAGPYKPVDLVTSYSASTPHAIRDPKDGSWLIFMTGCGVEACLAVEECDNMTTNSGANMYPCPHESQEPKLTVGHAQPCTCPKTGHAVPGPECSVDYGTNVLRGPTASGPWTLIAPLLDEEHPAFKHTDGTAWVFANPSALILENGTALVMYRDFLRKLDFPATNVIGLAASDNGWEGPYTRFFEKVFPDYAEDPHIYTDKRGNLHYIGHSLCNYLPKEKQPENCYVGGHAASADGGHTWHYSGDAAYTTTVAYEDGSSITYSRRERPEMLVNELGEPTHLITGVVEKGGNGQHDRSWTLVQPVRTPSTLV